ncbi:aldehyde dehydrogenase family protein [Pseudomonas lalucatii]|uniref:aldehyde dehydrogenase family protein n=1 Tax=Pseudomonas lalucatii TaxID=1424203 RepID=UPI001FEB8A52|nr:aldehyde dehydrogenase family protein [Pseudomonas lalucatii]
MSEIQLLPQVRDFLQRDHAHFINGRYCASACATRIPTINPANGQAIARVTGADDSAATTAVRQAFTSNWAETAPYQRGQTINRLTDLIEANGEELAQLETLCLGKSIHLPRMFEVGQSTMAGSLARVTLILGGINAAVLLPDADLGMAVAGLIQTGYVHQDQVCAAPERIYAHRSHQEETLAKIAAALQGINLSSTLGGSVQFGRRSSTRSRNWSVSD